jgi:glycosyltransferase involved in cell wall biosynthesis
MPDIIKHHENVYFAEPFSSQGFVEGIKFIMADKKRRNEFARKSRETTENNFSLESQVQKFIEVYTSPL